MEAKKLFDLSEAEIQAIIEPAQAKLKELNSGSLELIFTKLVESQANEAKKVARFMLKGSVGNAQSEALTQLVTSLKTQLEPYGQGAFNNRTEVTFTIGEKCPDVEKVEVIPTKEAKNITFPTGEVVLLDFWATWCGPCQRPMAHNQEMLEKNEEKWKGKVRIIGVSLDDNMDDVIKRIEDKKWNKIEHYWSPGAWESVAAKRFGLRGIPHVLLIDKEGKIQFVGHPAECDLEAKINELIGGTETAKPAEEKTEKTAEGHGHDHAHCDHDHKKEEHKDLTCKDQEEIFKTAEAEHQSRPKELPNVQNLTFTVQINNKYTKDKHSTEGFVRYQALCTSEDTSQAVDFGKILFAKFPNLKRENLLQQRVTQEPKVGTACGACKAVIAPGDAQYVCTRCIEDKKSDYAFCAACADKELTQDIQSVKELFHPHGLLFVPKDTDPASLKTLARQHNDVRVIDENEPWYAEWKASKEVQGVYCDGCEGSLKGYRYSCAHCRDFDYCPECFKASKDPAHADHEKIATRAKEQGTHDIGKHLFYRANFLLPINPKRPTPVEIPTA